MTPEAPHTICLLRLSAIGDTCNVVPTVRTLQKAFPDSRLTWIIGAVEHRLLEPLPGVEFITVDKRANRKAAKELRDSIRSRRFDVLLHMHASMRANLLSRHVRAERKIGFDRARARDFQHWFCNEQIAPRHQPHVVDGFLQFAEHLGAAPAAPVWNLPVPAADRAWARQTLPPSSLIISPCSSDRRQNFRNWSVDHYVRLANHAQSQHGLNVVLTGGPTDREMDYGRQISARVDALNLIGQTSLGQLLAAIEQADVVLCPDSGPAHMANAVGTPVVTLFATSNRHRTGPYRFQHLAADRYPDAVARYLNATVEQIRWGQRVRDPAAMTLITFDDVADKLALAVEDAASGRA